MATDPVCGIEVDAGQAEAQELSSEYEGTVYYFCAKGCKQAFKQNPQAYVDQSPSDD